MYFAGINGGGNLSRLMLQDDQGTLYGPYEGGPTNLNVNGMGEVIVAIRELIGQFLQDKGAAMEEIAALCIGSAGVDVPEDARRMEAVLEGAGFYCPVRAVNDTEVFLESEFPGEPGVVIICGAGAVALGRNEKGETHRAGGWGHLVGDEGSSYWIAREAIAGCLRSYDGRSGPTLLSELLCDHFEVDSVPDILGAVYDLDAGGIDIAGAADWVDRAAERGDSTAIGILSRGADGLFALAEAIFLQLELPEQTPVAYGGTRVSASEPLREMLEERLAGLTPQVRMVTRHPCLGAISLARALPVK